MRYKELTEAIRIKLGSMKPSHNVDDFLEELEGATEENWFNPHQRVVGGAAVEVSKFGQRVRINDIRALDFGKGHASKALKYLTDLADKHEVVLELTAKAYGKGRLTTKELVSWYSRHGFVNSGGTLQDGFDMVRQPKS